MLLEFKVRNFLSFDNEQVLSMNAGKGRNYNDRTYKGRYHKVLKFASLFGANGSGKSNFVKAVSFSRNYIVSGNNRATIQKYFKLNSINKDASSLFEFKIIIDEKLYTYGFEIILSKNEIVAEWLVYNTVKNDKIIYKYDKNNNSFEIGDYFKNKNLKSVLKIYADGVNSSNGVLFLKDICKYNNLYIDYSESTILRIIYNWFRNNLKVKFPDSKVTDYAYFMSEDNIDKIKNFFNDFDLSISDCKFIDCPQEQIALKLPKETFENLFARIEKDLLEGDDIENNRVLFGLQDDFYVARFSDNQVKCETIQFFHEGTNIPFYMNEESDGTKKIFKLLEILFQNDDNIVYVVDEIDRCLHPLLTYNFINAFLSKAKTSNCQLIVTTHETLLLDFNLLRKDEMWFVSKENGTTKLKPLGVTKERADKKLVKAYLLGNNAVPNIKDNAYKS